MPARNLARNLAAASALLFGLRAVADDVGDVIVAVFRLFDERSPFGLLHFQFVVDISLLASARLGVGILERHQFVVLVFLRVGVGLGLVARGRRSGGCG